MILSGKLIAIIGGAASIAVLGLIAMMLWYRADWIDEKAKREAAERELAIAVKANEENDKTIAILKEWKETSDRLYLELAEKLTAIAAETQATNEAIEKLRQTDATVRDYLTIPIPDELRKLLNGAKDRSGG